ncbi:hypothetical protein HanIR_Chr04g0167211 [Helianthus annuus]|nr:hypothetical protein HanIR_Chr04g0167211 [Helianthus annuus]
MYCFNVFLVLNFVRGEVEFRRRKWCRFEDGTHFFTSFCFFYFPDTRQRKIRISRSLLSVVCLLSILEKPQTTLYICCLFPSY